MPITMEVVDDPLENGKMMTRDKRLKTVYKPCLLVICVKDPAEHTARVSYRATINRQPERRAPSCCVWFWSAIPTHPTPTDFTGGNVFIACASPPVQPTTTTTMLRRQKVVMTRDGNALLLPPQPTSFRACPEECRSSTNYTGGGKKNQVVAYDSCQFTFTERAPMLKNVSARDWNDFTISRASVT
uniref:Uncharacterized protein n=1 Tax=Anopheles culicifacies TaxID=139723 RepID=A0A182M450_9DIPT